VLTPAVFDILSVMLADTRDGRVSLSAALSELAQREQYLALIQRGRRFDVGVKYGLFTAQLALALSGQDREEVLAELIRVLALREGLSEHGADV
jgi:UTP--glucose-1-phosphate uridylyltransferase